MTRTALALCLAGATLLTGCGETGDSFESVSINTTTLDSTVRTGRREGVRVWRDPDTGCQYLLWQRRQTGSMTPRLRPDGRPMCE